MIFRISMGPSGFVQPYCKGAAGASASVAERAAVIRSLTAAGGAPFIGEHYTRVAEGMVDSSGYGQQCTRSDVTSHSLHILADSRASHPWRML